MDRLLGSTRLLCGHEERWKGGGAVVAVCNGRRGNVERGDS